ncbi:hypothetical protein INT47_002503 [Mucor saturninus]|uniref:Uncharacterized protein n=1 Tax=Mucor saturninus TaxID=64648 RepID=A0A8H7V567_9FUNG|nr:hypothetical protein INT47_002503 [Mucor saturninus]
MGTNTLTFKSILIHAALEGCTRDILLTSTMTLYQLHKFILIAFGLNESGVEYHNFNLIKQLDPVETSYEIIDDQEVDGFITPVAPGVYIGKTKTKIFHIYRSNDKQ